MLYHRSGTLFEDMYWVDIETKTVVASEVNQTNECQIKYSKSTMKTVKNYRELLVIHTHPYSMSPSIRDFNSNLKNGYKISLICCHNGKIYMYQSKRYVSEFLYKGTVAKYRKMGYDDFEAQVCALKEYEQKGDIVFKEV
jgi:hypothetical protein